MFGGFTDSDFDAYAPRKWRSNAFNRERLEVKQKLLELGKLLAGQLCAADGSPLACEASAEHPALWNQKQVRCQQLYFSRNEAARRELDSIITRDRGLASLIEDPSPQRSHVFLLVQLSEDQLLIGLRLHTDATVDRHNLEKKVAEPWLRDELLALACQLDDRFAIGVGDGKSETMLMRELASESLEAMLTALAAPLGPHESRWLTVAHTMKAAAAVARGSDIVEDIRAELRALLPLYQFIAWSRDNDHVSIRKELRQQTLAKTRRGLAVHDQVRIVSGMFAGRSGVIDNISDKGVVRVLVGTLPVVVKADELVKA